MQIKYEELIVFLENESMKEIKYYAKPVNWIEHAIICTATSSRQINAILHKLEALVGKKERNTEGDLNSGWVIFSFSDIIVHIFLPEVREYYTLDELWSKKGVTNELSRD